MRKIIVAKYKKKNYFKRIKNTLKFIYIVKVLAILNFLTLLIFSLIKSKMNDKNINKEKEKESIINDQTNNTKSIIQKINQLNESIINNQTNITDSSISKINSTYIYPEITFKNSYAQFLEDLILYMFLYDIKEGFYIDVGANHPDDMSVTKYFYEKGWNGINIEPQDKEYKLLVEKRPKDINLKMCAGERKGFTTIYIKEGLTTNQKEYARSNKRKNVTIEKLSTICEKYIPKNKTIDFCKIDVEGAERDVLLGYDFKNYRPKIFCIESTAPLSIKFTHQKFEYILIENDYEFIYQYAINRFYIDKRVSGLKERVYGINNYIRKYYKGKNKIKYFPLNEEFDFKNLTKIYYSIK